ncbi:MAG: lysophospholipase, partial [Planctomycetes bacterium]|nr:lysophospholipase [Planctomycetota bacterium]
PRFLYGHSLGGNLVANFALRRHPELSGLVIASPLLLPTIPPPKWKVVLGHALNYVWPTATFNKGSDPYALSHDPEAVERYLEDPLVHYRVSARLAVEMLAAGRWALKHAGELSLPTLLMHGDDDPITSVEASRQFGANSRSSCTLKIWEGMVHELHWDTRRAEVLSYVIDWLRRQSSPRMGPFSRHSERDT